MRLDGVVCAAFRDELTKIAEHSLAGLSPELAHRAGQPPAMMETPASKKAKDVMERADQMKLAGARRRAEQTYETGHPYLRSGFVGAGGGALLAGLAHRNPSMAFRRGSTATGAALGVGDELITRHLKSKKQAKTAAAGLAMEAKAAKQTGMHTGHALHMGPKASGVIRPMGKFGKLPTMPGV